MGKQFISPELAAEQKKWYAKLKADGFCDIEQTPGVDDSMLKKWASSALIHNFDMIKYAAKSEYYQLAGHFLNSHEFASNFERSIWDKHSEGMSIRCICEYLAKHYRKQSSGRDKVHSIIEKLRIVMLSEARYGNE